MLLPLTDIQKQTFTVIQSFINTNNYPPTIPEIQRLLNVENPGQIHKIFCALENKGYILRPKKGKHRGLEITQEAKEKLQ